MKISVFGLGYVGTVSAVCLAADGHTVVGVDTNKAKVDLIYRQTSPLVERDVRAMMEDAVQRRLLRATSNARDAVFDSEVSLICVGTPGRTDGSLDLTSVRRVCQDIGAALKEKTTFHVVVVRSTMLPGSMRGTVIPILEAYSGKCAGEDFGVCYNPEFLREGTAVEDYYHPPKIVLGELDQHSADAAVAIYGALQAPWIRTSLEAAEMIKYADNAWHAVKVSFANEIGDICQAAGVDGQEVMEIFCQDTKLNLSPCYLRPGFAFGGSCLPKDVRALTRRGHELGLALPLLNAIMPSNEGQVEAALAAIVNAGNRRIGVLGFSFKEGTDDLRESPMLNIVDRLIQQGFDLHLYDTNFERALVAGCQDASSHCVPGIARLTAASVDEVLACADTVVIGSTDPAFRDVPGRLRRGQVLVDLVRMSGRAEGGHLSVQCADCSPAALSADIPGKITGKYYESGAYSRRVTRSQSTTTPGSTATGVSPVSSAVSGLR